MSVTQETFNATDRKEIQRIIVNLRDSYLDRLHTASEELHQAQRQANRAAHEVSRLKKHLERIDAFCEKNTIEIGEE